MAKKPFTPPTLAECEAYAKEQGLQIDPVKFWRIFDANEWHDSNDKPVKRWKGKMITWDYFQKERAEEINNRRSAKKIELFPISGKTCSYEGCALPAVYKDTSGAYDHYKCNKHLPDEVKKLYG